ncbi:PaaI family thioesterase [Halalkalibacterium halodurans]|uniref:BH2602 protein n=1 Tax=Halalkalibacterium halodurans (strain ATCC BAA-125 / DSM 18197 / FERM 7344 / JCM 9153 / C-125) TaxID=272558 RepID=Q9K9P3_HALH5|nr:PaaI family thioesterase [Halalkalibacterium halodurans]MDY7223138.1 PaaI family thioesterase [Halalkalibacterium halodurans]MDY7242359.1 PaaI family thioesterase [Halalkalibacterium halodurans]MED3647878.1 PaaI family thioesterase [Halalkalibacterium halodurans]MED4079746.1 PaaI family thioesterase [Halalkalibacterium halodurans]MED4086312.1 PaaI family thioesterase [Halalkalibacterium halodurans]
MDKRLQQDRIVDKMERFLSTANEEEKDVLSSIVDGLLAKQERRYATYLASLTQIESQEREDGRFEVRLPIGPLVNNPLNMVHGGITATLLDTAMGQMVNRQLPDGQSAVTSELNIHYVKPGMGTYLRAVASIVHQGKQRIVVEGKVYTDQGETVAMGTGSFFVLRSRG